MKLSNKILDIVLVAIIAIEFGTFCFSMCIPMLIKQPNAMFNRNTLFAWIGWSFCLFAFTIIIFSAKKIYDFLQDDEK